MAAYTRILSIDGGGIRGIIPGQVLVSLERKLQKRTGNNEARIADFFDLIAGTSTGGILTCIYLCPNANKRPRFSAQEAVDLYLNKGDDIFTISLWQKIKSLSGVLDEKYNAEGLETNLKEYFDELKLSDLLKPCLIPAYDIKERAAKFYTQHDAVIDEGQNFYIKDVARATSAAPTYFEVCDVQSLSGVHYPSIDGGVFANNPALCAYAEVREKFKNKPTAKDMVILSIGTGYAHKQPYEYTKAKDWGMLEWVKPLLNIMMSGVSETVDYQLTQMFKTIDHPEQYLRINMELLDGSPDMDNATPENLDALRQDGIRLAQEVDDKLNSFVDLLLT